MGEIAMPNRFDQMAMGYDTDKRTQRAALIANELRAKITAGMTGVEFGCGTGLVGLGLADMFSELVLLDSSQGMLAECERKIAELGLDNAGVLCADIVSTPPKNLRADYIFSLLVLHHIPDTEKAFISLYNLLNNGGKLLIVDINPDGGSFHANYSDYDGHNGFEQEYLTALARNTGFKAAVSKTFYYGEKNSAPYSLFIFEATK